MCFGKSRPHRSYARSTRSASPSVSAGPATCCANSARLYSRPSKTTSTCRLMEEKSGDAPHPPTISIAWFAENGWRDARATHGVRSACSLMASVSRATVVAETLLTHEPLAQERRQQFVDARLDVVGRRLVIRTQPAADRFAIEPLLDQRPDARAGRVELEDAIAFEMNEHRRSTHVSRDDAVARTQSHAWQRTGCHMISQGNPAGFFVFPARCDARVIHKSAGRPNARMQNCKLLITTSADSGK